MIHYPDLYADFKHDNFKLYPCGEHTYETRYLQHKTV
jgi:hypothetical protein